MGRGSATGGRRRGPRGRRVVIGPGRRPAGPRLRARRAAAGLGALLGSAWALTAAAGSAQEPQASEPRRLHPEAAEAISKIRSPYCPGFMLEVCPSPDAAALRDSINDRALAGIDADAIVELVVAAHGEEYRGFPRTEGTGLLAWVIPPAALALGLAVVVVALRRLRRPPDVAVAQGRLTDADRARLDAALAEMEEME